MRRVPDALTAAWLRPDKTGRRRPVVRATIQRTALAIHTYDTANWPGGSEERAEDEHTIGEYSSILFGNNNPVREIENIRELTWERSLDQDVATATLTLLNTEVTPIGNAQEVSSTGEFDQPGYYTPSRGRTDAAQNRWGHEANGWKNIFVPDMLVRTYEGYGQDRNYAPCNDPKLVQTGVWLIDKVSLDSEGNITLEMRDLARLMLEQLAFPPVVPKAEYPLGWRAFRRIQVAARDSKGGKWVYPTSKLGKATSSNKFYAGRGLTNGTEDYLDQDGNAHRGAPSYAANDDYGDYWRSGMQPLQTSLVWWQYDFKDKTTAMNGIRVRTIGTTFIYISLLGRKGWIGRKKIPYDPTTSAYETDIGADIPFVMKVRAEGSRMFDITLPTKYGDIRAVRLTMETGLTDSARRPYTWWTGVRNFAIYTNKSVAKLKFGKGTIFKTVGNYRDYSTIPTWVAAWAGFWMPEPSTKQLYELTGRTNPDGSREKRYYDYPIAGGVRLNNLARGMVWGHFQKSYTVGKADLTPDMFDKKPIMDMINYVRDLLGFIFYVDEVGSVYWRMPNIFVRSNIEVSQSGTGTLEDPIHQEWKVVRGANYMTVDENETLISYQTSLSSANIRERIFVANATGDFGTVIEGYNPNKTGMRRMAGWTDQNFASKEETTVMADMIATRAMFDYRRGRLSMPGNPSIQMDDQIRIIERITNETYFHYVMGVKSTNNMEEGTWIYDVETHWLGEDPDGDGTWAINQRELKAETRAYLARMKG